MAKIQLRFSVPEMALIVNAMKLSSYPSIHSSPFEALSEEASKGALLAARDGLFARGLARMGKDGDLELHPLVLAGVGVAVRPQIGFWLSVVGDGTEPSSIYFNWTDKIIVSNWVDAAGIFCFEQIKDQNQIAEDVLRHSLVDPTEDGKKEEGYVVPASLLDHIANNRELEETSIADLVSEGVPNAQAREVAQVIAHPKQRSILIAASHMREQPTTAGFVIWLAQGEQRWLLTEHTENGNSAYMRRAYGSHILKAVSNLVLGVIGEYSEQA
jgi:hypothetical protein